MNLDRELQAALDVDPSPEFEARVRMRVADEQMSRRWKFWWMPATAVAVAIVIVFAVLVALDEVALKPPSMVVAGSTPSSAPGNGEARRDRAARQDAAAQTPGAAQSPTAQTALPSQAAPIAQAAQVARVQPPAGVDRDRDGASRLGVHANNLDVSRHLSLAAAATTETLIDPREVATLRRLIAGVGDGRVDLKAVLNPAPFVIADAGPVIEMPPVDEILIAPILIEPLPTGGEGARQ